MAEKWRLSRIQGNRETEKYQSSSLKELFNMAKLKGLLHIPKK